MDHDRPFVHRGQRRRIQFVRGCVSLWVETLCPHCAHRHFHRSYWLHHGHARLLADGAGVVLAVDAEVGQVVSPGTPVVRLAARDGARDVVIAVPEDRVGQIKVGTSAQVRLWAGAGGAGATPAPLTAVVREVAASAERGYAHLPGQTCAARRRHRAAGRHRLRDAGAARPASSRPAR